MPDRIDEDDERFTLRLSLAGNTTDTRIEVAGLIMDDDDPPVLSINDATVDEGEMLPFAVALSAPSSRDIRVDWSLIPGTAEAGVDYVLESGTLMLPPGARTGIITVSSIDDAVYEADETVTLQLSSPQHATLNRERAVGTIRNNDVLPTLSITDAEAEEGQDLIFPLTLSEAIPLSVNVDWLLSSGTAEADVDYVAESGVLTIPAGETTGNITVMSIQDALDETDETLAVTLSAPRHAALGQATAIGTVLDEDAAPALLIDSMPVTAAALSVMEGEALSIDLMLSAPSSLPVSLAWESEDGTAVAGEDYTAAQGVITLAPGETAARIDVPTLDDKQVEADETLRLVFTEPQHVMPPGALTVTIHDDDAAKAAELENVNRAILPQVSAALAHTRLNQLQDCMDESIRQTDVGATLTGLVQRLPRDNAALQGDDRSVWERFGGSKYKRTFSAGGDEHGEHEANRAALPGSSFREGLSPYVGDITVCAGVDWRRLADERLGTDWDGSLYGGHLGGHVRLGTYTLAGVTVSQQFVDIDYAEAGESDGEWDLSLTGVQPYFSRSWEAGQRIWAMAGRCVWGCAGCGGRG